MIMQAGLPDSCPLKTRLGQKKYYSDSSASTVKEIIGVLESLGEWEKTMDKPSENRKAKEYDVFLSHAMNGLRCG